MPNEPNDPNDPDAQGLPPGVQLPDANLFRRDQLFIQMLINFVFLATLIFWSLLFASERSQTIAWLSTAFAGLVVLYSVVRWQWARAACKKAIPSASQSSKSP